MEIITTQYLTIDCIEAVQPIGTMYVAVIDSGDLEVISYADVRRLEMGNENREIETYIGIQRELNKNREKDLGRYVNLIDASFPNSIILAISSEYATYDPISKKMSIVLKQDVAKVLDGQHRIAGLRHYEKDSKTFQCIVTIYIDMDLEDQAIVFATINKEQKSVSNSLVADLFAFAESRSPQKTGHNIARALNRKEESPFFGKIKILGTARNKEKETITQATFVQSLLKYISPNPQSDRDFFKRNKNKKTKLPLCEGAEFQRYFLRNMFISDDNDIQIAQLLFNFFYAVQHKWPTAWNEVRPNNILNKSTGFIALMRFFKDAYLSLNKGGSIVSKDDFASLLQPIQIDDDYFTTNNYKPGSSGQSQLYKDLVEKSGIAKST